jgi:hypothetical protein
VSFVPRGDHVFSDGSCVSTLLGLLWVLGVLWSGRDVLGVMWSGCAGSAMVRLCWECYGWRRAAGGRREPRAPGPPGAASRGHKRDGGAPNVNPGAGMGAGDGLMRG